MTLRLAQIIRHPIKTHGRDVSVGQDWTLQ